MDILEQEHDDVLVLAPVGRLDSSTAGVFEQTVLGHVDGGRARLVIDFDQLEYISSAGLRVLLMAAKRLRQSGGRLALCAVRPQIQEVFEISGFLSIFTVSDNQAEALRVVTA